MFVSFVCHVGICLGIYKRGLSKNIKIVTSFFDMRQETSIGKGKEYRH